MHKYFCGWYYRFQSDHQTLALIPSIHKNKGTRFCTIQLITNDSSFHVQFPDSYFQKDGSLVRIGNNCFSKNGISLDLRTPELRATGCLRFGEFTPILYDIMGPFRFIPFLQCRHSVFSMRHRVDGELFINGEAYLFQNAVGYLEGDRGRSFPKEYAWTYCSFPEGALMLSVADIPLGCFHFTGVIGLLLLQGKEYRLATYLGARVVQMQNGQIIVQQGGLRLTVQQRGPSGYPLRAPVDGAMTRTIHEHPSCKVYYRLTDGSTTLLDLEAPNAAFEYEY